jgi:Tol biopolymer transport system component
VIARRSISLAVAVAAAAALGAAASDSQAAFPGQAGRIAFSVNAPGPDIETVNPDGSDPQLLTHNPSTCPCDLDPTWSPGGDQIAFTRLDKNGGPFRIWVMSADGANPHPVSPGPSDQQPAWSPDGRQLVYTSKAGTGDDQLAVINVDGSGLHLIGPRGIGTGNAAWSPDSSSIAFNHSGPNGSLDLFAIRPDGSGLRDLTNNPRPSGCGGPESIDPDWSPDGSRLAYSGDETVCGNPVVMTIAADGSGRTQIGREDPPGPDHEGQLGPVWSPDRTHIAYAQAPPSSPFFSQIYVMDADGGNPHAITSGAFAHRDPSWQPRPIGQPKPASLILSPKTATNQVDQQHCVVAGVKDELGHPASGATVRFDVSGADNTGGSATTDASGNARFCYTGPPLPGSDTVKAFADANKNGSQNPGEPGDTATKTWVLPGSTAGCKVTQGGRISAANGDKATFGGNARGDSPKGEEQYTDHGPRTRMAVHSLSVQAVHCSGDRKSAGIFGTATIDGRGSHLFRIDVKDLGEPGRADSYRIRLGNGYDSGEQTLGSGGNVQIHSR